MLAGLVACVFVTAEDRAERLDQRSGDDVTPADTAGTDTADTTDTADSGVEARLAIESVYPEYGSTEGGESVILYGTGFAEGVTVSFGYEEARLVEVLSDRIEVESPGGRDADIVDVTVAIGRREEVLRDAFSFWEDRSGQVGALGGLRRIQRVGGYWADGVVLDQVLGRIDLGLSEEHHYEQYAPAIGSCGSPQTSPFMIPAWDEGGSLVATSTTGSLTFYASEGSWEPDALDTAIWVPGEAWTLEAEGLAEVPDFTLDDAWTIPLAAPAVSEPAIDADTPPPIAEQQAVRWDAGEGDYVVIWMTLYSTDDSTVLDELACVSDDDGSFTLGSGAWPFWYTDRRVDILLGRVVLGSGRMPFNNARVETAAIAWTAGVAISE